SNEPPEDQEDTTKEGPSEPPKEQAETWTVKRAQHGTVAEPHAKNAPVLLIPKEAPPTKGLFDQIQKAIAEVPFAAARTQLGSFVSLAAGDVEKWRASVEQWFEDKMDRV